MLDLCIDSRDRALDIPCHHGPNPIRELAPQVVHKAVAQAIPLWEKYRDPNNLIDAFMWAKQYYATHGGLGFYNMSQHAMALAFCYARAGDLVKAYRELDEHGPGLDDEEFAKIRQKFESAAGP
jgi:hypothetical protein